MSNSPGKQGRRSTRLSISIPIIISGVDDQGNKFSETARTLIVNRHGGKVVSARSLPIGAEVLIENLALGAVGKASVVWRGEEKYPDGLCHLGLQLAEAQNVWGIAFPPEDWAAGPEDQRVLTQQATATGETTVNGLAETPGAAVSGGRTSAGLPEEFREFANRQAQQFEERLRQVSHRLGSELEIELRQHAANAKAGELASLEKDIQTLRETVNAAREEVKALTASIDEVKRSAESKDSAAPSLSLQDAERRLTTLMNSVVEGMNRAADAGLSEYRRLLERENRETVTQQRRAAEAGAPASQV